MTSIETQDRIDAHTRQAWALAELLQSHFSDEERDPMTDTVMVCLMENMADHLRHIRALNSGEEAAAS